MSGTRVPALVSALVVVVVASACGGEPERDAAPDPSSAAPTSTAAPTTTGLSILNGGIVRVCDEGIGFPDATPYEGSGPHALWLITEVTDAVPAEQRGIGADDDVATLPTEWEGDPLTELRLVACADVTAVTKVEDCGYYGLGPQAGPPDYTAELFSRTLSIEVRAARTGEVVGAPLTATTESNACAGTVDLPESPGTPLERQYGTLTDAQVQALLAPLVTATV